MDITPANGNFKDDHEGDDLTESLVFTPDLRYTAVISVHLLFCISNCMSTLWGKHIYTNDSAD